ncbi:MarR family winged helix-turn-helix transcriptional regulator [Allopusillimonas ginsengisoli]|uniref:MarR family winged helix-turn-helix transcriptional regulator n=1 Tax=Allopusillimonas ginsengisoli TaxID=453575 RepID=UPI00102106C8|nr:MarR family winged helix-turn-helix transcriptional regulator [Allopusillimonas ginsengisoli]TEA79508.1 MarR family transcriptional regulator [Allopusillimonas ginsengisoli]
MSFSAPHRDPKASHSPTLHDMMMFRLYRAWSAGNPIFTRLCEGRFNITRREWRILAIVAQHGALTSTDLAHAAALDAARTSRAISTLCQKKLLERTRGQPDARTVQVSASSAGMQLYEEIMPIVADLNDLIFQDLSSQELHAFGTMLDRIIRRAGLMLEEDLIKERVHRGRAGGYSG